MNPFFFGSSDRALLGVYHPPQSRSARPHGVVLCYPTGQEYLRAHRAFRQLAALLAREGFHVLRFDYHATGDSSGDGLDATVSHWTADVRTAVSELHAMSGGVEASIVGLRLGATLAAAACAGEAERVASLLLWDPILRGDDYLKELGCAPALATAGTGEVVEVMGFPMTPSLAAGIAGLDLASLSPLAADKVFVLVSRESNAARALCAGFEKGGSTSTYRCIPAPGNWARLDDIGSALLPHTIIKGVVETLARSFP